MNDDDRVARMLRGLAEAPRFTGLSLRGHREPGATLGYGRAVVTTWICPTSLDIRVATGNGRTDQVFAILGDDGADLRQLSAMPLERDGPHLVPLVVVERAVRLVARRKIALDHRGFAGHLRRAGELPTVT